MHKDATYRDDFWGPLVRELRLAKSISQRQLADDARVSRHTLRAIEEGHTSGTIAVMERLLRLLGHEIEALQIQPN